MYGDFTDFPHAILTSGARDLFLSLTMLTHRKLRRASVEAELIYEGMSHAQSIRPNESCNGRVRPGLAFHPRGHFNAGVKYRKSGGGWFLRAGIRRPSALRK